MHRFRDASVERAASEVWSKIARIAGADNAVIFGSVAVSSWIKREVAPSDIDILVNRLHLDSHSFKEGLRALGFSGVPSYIAYHEDDFSVYHNDGVNDPVKVHLVSRFGDGGLFDNLFGVSIDEFFEHSSMKRDRNGEIRILDMNLLLFTKWHGFLSRDNGSMDLRDIRAILAWHYNGSADEFVEREIDVIMKALGIARTNDFLDFMRSLQISIEAMKSVRE